MPTLQYKVKENISLINRLTNETIRGNIINEKEIEGKQYWVMMTTNRPGAQLIFSKDAWSMQKGKVK